MLITLAVAGYRSLRELVLPLGRLNVVTGANGSGKTSLYRALRLLAETAQGRVIAALADEGGLGSTLWAGPERFSRAMKAGEAPVEGGLRRARVGLRLGFADQDWGYAIDLGLPQSPGSAFGRDPEIKAEAVWTGEHLTKRNAIAVRGGPAVRVADGAGTFHIPVRDLAPYDSMMTHAADPRGTPELITLRERMRGWRFYETFRVDRDAAARRPRVGTRTPALASDGADLGAALQTIREIGDADGLDAVIEDAFPGGAVAVTFADGLFRVEMYQRGLLRPLDAAELSDGKLRYLLLAAALMTPRPPRLMVLNEPESSLDPALIAPLARLIARASAQSQIIVVSHHAPLVEALRGAQGEVIRLEKVLGETLASDIEPPPWSWPKR